MHLKKTSFICHILKYFYLILFISSCYCVKFDDFLNRSPVIVKSGDPKEKILTSPHPVIVKSGYSKGKILIVPLLGSGSIGLYNKKGYFEKIWDLKKPTFYGELMEDKILIVHLHKGVLRNKGIKDLDKIPKEPFYMLGSTGIIAVYDYKGQMQNSFEDISLHHDISVKNQHKIFALSWGIKTVLYKNEPFMIMEDSIVEIDISKSKLIKKLPLSDYFPVDEHLSMSKKHPQKDRLNDIFHANGIDYIKENPINGNEAVLITMKSYNEGTIGLIDLKTNKVLWKSEKGVFTLPHDAKFTKDGTITVFNNGRKESMRSEIMELNIKTNEVLWKFDGTDKDVLLQFKLFSPSFSGVHKTEKGYLVTVGNQGRVLEISKDKEIVWELPAAVSFFRGFIGNGLATEIFKVRQYQ